jgi:hypothetical protein
MNNQELAFINRLYEVAGGLFVYETIQIGNKMVAGHKIFDEITTFRINFVDPYNPVNNITHSIDRGINILKIVIRFKVDQFKATANLFQFILVQQGILLQMFK